MVVPRGPGEPRVLSFGQERLWYLDQLAPKKPVYNLPYFTRLRGDLNVEALRQALHAIIGRHEILRTVIIPQRGGPRPILLKNWTAGLEQADLRNIPTAERESAAWERIRLEGEKPFDFSRDLMLRTLLIRLTDQEWIFFHNAPHLAFEGGSIAILYDDLKHYYDAFVAGVSAALRDLPVQYADFAHWQRSCLTEARIETLKSFWKRQLSDAVLIDLPLDFPRPPVHTMRGHRHFFSMPCDLIQAANELSKASGTTSYRGLLATFNVFLHCYTGQTDFSIGSPFAPRCDGLEGIIGFFVNTVVIRIDLSGNPTFREIMKRVDEAVTAAVAHSELPLSKVVEAVEPPRDVSRTPLFQVNFRAPRKPYPAPNFAGIEGERARYTDNGTSKFDLALEIDASNGEACYFEYCSDLFKEETILEAISDFQKLLCGLLAEPDVRLNQLQGVREIRERVNSRRVR